MRLYAHFMAGIAGLDLGLALVLMYEMAKQVLNGSRRLLGDLVMIFSWGILANFIIIIRFLGDPDKVRAAWLYPAIYVILILSGWVMAEKAMFLRKGDPDE